MTTIYLHIGANKTGSSAIQDFLNKNRGALREDGFHYIENVHDNAHYPLSYALGCGPNLNAVDKDSELKKTLKEIEQNKEKKILISSEYFILEDDPRKLANYFRGHDVKIVVYLRRHDLWLESLYNQAVKTVPVIPWDGGILSYIDHIGGKKKQELSYKSLLEKWENVFGSSNIIVRPYESAAFPNGDIVSDFIKVIKLKRKGKYKPSEGIINKSIPLQYLRLLELMKKTNKFDSYELSRVLRWMLHKDSDTRLTLLSEEDREKIILNNEEEYCYIADRYGLENEKMFSNMSFPKGKRVVGKVSLIEAFRVISDMASDIKH